MRTADNFGHRTPNELSCLNATRFTQPQRQRFFEADSRPIPPTGDLPRSRRGDFSIASYAGTLLSQLLPQVTSTAAIAERCLMACYSRTWNRCGRRLAAGWQNTTPSDHTNHWAVSDPSSFYTNRDSLLIVRLSSRPISIVTWPSGGLVRINALLPTTVLSNQNWAFKPPGNPTPR